MSSDIVLSYLNGDVVKKRGLVRKLFHFLSYKGMISLLILMIILIFGLQNSESTSVQFLFWKVIEVSKLNLIFISVSLGVVLGVFLGISLKKLFYR